MLALRHEMRDKELVQHTETNRLRMLQTVLNCTHKRKSKAAIKILPSSVLEIVLKQSGLLSPAPPVYSTLPDGIRLPFAHAVTNNSELLSPFIFRVYQNGSPIFQHQVGDGEIHFFFEAKSAVQRMFSVVHKSQKTIHVYYGSRTAAGEPSAPRVGCCDTAHENGTNGTHGDIHWQIEKD